MQLVLVVLCVILGGLIPIGLYYYVHHYHEIDEYERQLKRKRREQSGR